MVRISRDVEMDGGVICVGDIGASFDVPFLDMMTDGQLNGIGYKVVANMLADTISSLSRGLRAVGGREGELINDVIHKLEDNIVS